VKFTPAGGIGLAGAGLRAGKVASSCFGHVFADLGYNMLEARCHMTSAARKCMVALGLILAVGVAAAGGYALGLQSTRPTPTLFSGVDVGFRMEGRKGNTPVGRLVVRIDAQWVAVDVATVARVAATDAR
jgi:hypothetical protein